MCIRDSLKKMDLDKSFLNRDDLSQEDSERWPTSTEFPNGGARVIENHIEEKGFQEADYYPNSREEEISLEHKSLKEAEDFTDFVILPN